MDIHRQSGNKHYTVRFQRVKRNHKSKSGHKIGKCEQASLLGYFFLIVSKSSQGTKTEAIFIADLLKSHILCLFYGST